MDASLPRPWFPEVSPLLWEAFEREIEPRGDGWREQTRRAVLKINREAIERKIIDETLAVLRRFLAEKDIRASEIAALLGISRAAVSQWWKTKKISRHSIEELERHFPGIFASVHLPNARTRKERAVAGYIASMVFVRREVLGENCDGPASRVEFAWLEHALGCASQTGLTTVIADGAPMVATELAELGLSGVRWRPSAPELGELVGNWLRPFVYVVVFLSEVAPPITSGPRIGYER